MELAQILKILWKRKLATLTIVLVAAAGATAVALKTKSVPTGAATVQILVDSPDSALANIVQNTVPLTERASVFAQVMASQAVLQDIAGAAGISAAQLTAQGPYSGSGQPLNAVTPSEARGRQLISERAKYRLTFVAQANEPVITASVQGPTPASAGRLAGAVFTGIQRYIAGLQINTPVQHRVTIRQLGDPQAGSVNSSSRMTLMALTIVGVLLLGLLALLGFDSARRRSEPQPLEPDFAADFDRVVLDPRASLPVSAGVAGEERTG
jgi:Chain length determinant protein